MAAPPVHARAYRMARGPVQDVEAAYRDLLHALYAAGQEGADANPLELKLTDEARSIFADFVNANGQAVASLPETSPLRAAWSKSDGACGSLALVLDRATRASLGKDLSEAHSVSGESMQVAVELTRWFQRETLRLYQRYGFDEAAATPEEEMSARLPEAFSWQDAAREWRIRTKSGTMKRLRRLILLGLVRKLGQAEYEVVGKPDALERVSAQFIAGHLGHSGHLLQESGEDEPETLDTQYPQSVHEQDAMRTPSSPPLAENAKVSDGALKVSNGRTPINSLCGAERGESVQGVLSAHDHAKAEARRRPYRAFLFRFYKRA